MANSFGDFFRRKRMALDLTLREFCERAGLDPGNMSKIERGKLPPPRERAKLEHYAACLELRPGTDDYLEFFDLAAAEHGQLPDDLANDEEVVRQLPLLFRTLRGDPVPADRLRELVRRVREG